MRKTPDVELLGPGPFSWKGSATIWVIAASLLALLWWRTLSNDIGTPGNGWGGLYALSGVTLGFAGLLQYLILANRDVVVSVEGVRKGKGPRSTFIPWQGAAVIYDRSSGRFVVSGNGKRIPFNWINFNDLSRYREVMQYVLYVIYQQSFRRHGQAAKIEAPIHSLSAADRVAFLNDKGSGFERAVWPYLSVVLLAACLAYLTFIGLLIVHPPVGPDMRRLINLILHKAPLPFTRSAGPYFLLGSLAGIVFIAWDRISTFMSRGTLKRLKLNWLAQFEKTQRVALSEIGLTQQDADGPSFWVWNDIHRIRRTKGLILFDLTPAQTLSVIVPKRIFATPADAEDFVRKAQAFKDAAKTRPNIVEPISFWEIA